MGLYYSVYVGPYLEVDHVEKPEVKVSWRCSNSQCGCSLKTQAKFCAQCGASVERQEQKTPRLAMPLPWDLENPAIDEWMWAPESVCRTLGQNSQGAAFGVWLPNRRGYGKTMEGGDGHLTEISAGNIEEELRKFREDHEPVLSAMKEKLGVVPRLKYGVVGYVS